MNALYDTLPIGKIDLPNRICFLAHRTNFGRQGRLTERHIAYYERRAKGGAGLIIVGEMSITTDDRPWASMIELYHPDAPADLKRLTGAIHQYDTRVFALLGHHGFQSSGHITRQAVWAPSAMADIAFGETGKAMEETDMDALVDGFARAAGLVKDAGFDGIQIDMGAESLLRQFLSPISNQRQDAYGGSVENRLRLPLRIVDAVRHAVGAAYPVGLKLCVDEKFWGGIDATEAVQFAQVFEQTGQVDFIQTDLSTYYNLYLVMASMHTPAGFTLDLAEAIKQSVSIPVIAAYQIDFPSMAEEAIAGGKADAVGFVRALIADPDMAVKHREGKTDTIRWCARDNLGCVGRVNQSKPIACVQNPRVGNEATPWLASQKAATPKQVVVIGAGPAGMAAAVSAARKGHRVNVYEKSDVTGGQVNFSKQGAGRSGMANLTHYLEKNLARLEVPVHLGAVLDADQVIGMKADAVVVATGGEPVAHPYPGNYGPPDVITVWDVYQGNHPLGEKILLIDEIGSHVTLASAEHLADQGKQVHIVTSELFVGVGVATLGDLYFTRQRLLQKGATFQTDTAVEKIEGRRVVARNVFTNQTVVFEDYDTVIVAAAFAAVDGLYYKLKGRVGELYQAGDCVAPRGIEMAIYEGEKVGGQL